jgi:hypothetical protein
MDEWQMIQILESAGTILRLGGFAALGVAVGLVHFHALRRTADLLVKGRGAALALALTFARIALTVAVFLWAVTGGALALLSVAAGVMVGRGLVLRSKVRGAE